MMHAVDGRSRIRLLGGLACGVAAPLLYAVTVIWGATQIPGYSHLANAISELTAAGRQNMEPVQMLLVVYNLLVIGFATVGLIAVRRPIEWAISFALLQVSAVLGLLMWPFPTDPPGVAMTAGGVMHIVLAALLSLATMGAIGAAALGWRRVPGGMGMAIFSAACLMVVFVSGLLAAVATAGGWPLMGLYERITIGGFELWMLASAFVFIARVPRSDKALAQTA